jgi:hypothetical protein
MNDPGTLVQNVIWLLALAAAIVLTVRLLAGPNPPGLAGLFSAGPIEMPWPQGVQEEEPVRWNIEPTRVSSIRGEPAAPEMLRGRRSPLIRTHRARRRSMDQHAT